MATTLDASRTKRLVTAALGACLWAFALDAWMSHYAGKVEGHPTQILPVLMGGVGGLLLMLVAVPRKASSLRAGTLAFVGILSIAVGLGGAWFHIGSFFQTMGPDAWTSENLQGALSVSPPPFPPFAFVGLGTVMCLVGMNRLMMTVTLGRRSTAVPPPARAKRTRPAEPAFVASVSKRRAAGR